jgi:hypothetical protein
VCKTKICQAKARVLRALLRRYAAVDDDAQLILGIMSEFLYDVESGKIVPPTFDEHKTYFDSPQGPLYKYADLVEAHAQYSDALEDMHSG